MRESRSPRESRGSGRARSVPSFHRPDSNRVLAMIMGEKGLPGRGWMAKVNVRPEGGMDLDQRFFLESDGMRPHQVRLEGGDASSDSYCYA